MLRIRSGASARTYQRSLTIANEAGISRVVVIHCGSPRSEDIVGRLRRGYHGNGYSGCIVRPDELTTVEI